MKRRRSEEHENHERWLVSYADFITLLFAFFVVMYSISSVNEGKYRVLSDTLDAAFKESTRSLNPIQIGEVVRSPNVNQQNTLPATGIGAMEDPVTPIFEEQTEEQEASEATEATEDVPTGNSPRGELKDTQAEAGNDLATLETIAQNVEQKMSPLIDEELVEVRREDNWIEVEMKSNTLFGSGSARLQTEAIPVLRKLSDNFKNYDNPIQVEGFTDNVPIQTAAYPSNWELSAARAASVVHLFTRFGINPDRMSAIGYGEHRTVADNSTPEGRQKNRRVVIIIAADQDTRRIVDLNRATSSQQQTQSTPPEGPAQ